MKAGDIDPRCKRAHCFTVSDKALAVAGGVLEALSRFSGGDAQYRATFHFPCAISNSPPKQGDGSLE
jgi:hypothetical protein